MYDVQQLSFSLSEDVLFLRRLRREPPELGVVGGDRGVDVAHHLPIFSASATQDSAIAAAAPWSR